MATDFQQKIYALGGDSAQVRLTRLERGKPYKRRGTDVSPSGATTSPIKQIVLWSGTVNTIPKGWALCDGRLGTPNLSMNFLVVANSNPTYYTVAYIQEL